MAHDWPREIGAPLVHRWSSDRPSARKDWEPAADSLAGRLLRAARLRPGQWAMVAAHVRRGNWVWTEEATAVYRLKRHGLIEIDYQPARWLQENIWIKAL